jgi:hypothetical protein
MGRASCLSLFYLFSATGWKPVPLCLTASFFTLFRVCAGNGAAQDFEETETLKCCQQKFNSSLRGSLVVQSASSALSASSADK